MRFISWISMLLFLAPGVGSVQADTLSAEGVFDWVSVYTGQGVNHNLLQLPGRITAGDLEWDKAYFTAIEFGKIRGTLGASVENLQGTPLASFRHGYETVLVKHYGLANNAEIGAAYMLKTPDLRLGLLGVNFGAGTGLSYALSDPAYDDSPDNEPGRHYRMQLLALFEIEWRLTGLDNLSVITRVHHRSGVYGLIAPKHVGSNFLAAGVRYKF
jgi:hypothetical protein